MLGERSVKLLTLFGIRIGASPSWFVVLFVVILLLSQQFEEVLGGSQTRAYVVAVLSALLFFLSLILHELGHALTARRHGIEIAGIDLWLFGGIARLRQDSDSPGTEFKVAAAGPAVSLLIGAACLGASWLIAGGSDTADVVLLDSGSGIGVALAVLAFLGTMNLFLFAVNLLPAFPLDGGRLARAIVWKVTGDRHRATRIAGRVGQGAGYLAIAAGLAIALQGNVVDGIWIAVLGWLVAGAARGAVVSTAFTERLEGVTVADVMDPHPVAVPAATEALRAQDEFFLRYRSDWFPVIDDGGRFVGTVRRERIEQAVGSGRPALAAGDLVEPDAADWRVAADQPIEALLGSERLGRLGALMAVDPDGVLRGVVTVDQVRRAVAAALPGH